MTEIQTTNQFLSNNYAYVTLLTTDSYLPGAETLIKSIKSMKTKYPIICLITSNLSLATKVCIKKLDVELINVDFIGIGGDIISCRKDMPSGWTAEYTKLNIWNLTNYNKIIYIDCDALVLDNIDDLFDITKDQSFSAVPDVFPPDKFNAGVLVIEPNVDIFNDMIEKIKTLKSYDGGDTGFLNAYFPNWYTSPSSCRLPYSYNAQRMLYWFTHDNCPGYWNICKPIKIIHYSSSPKPWEMKPNSKDSSTATSNSKNDSKGKGIGELEMIWWEKQIEMQMPVGLASLFQL